MRASRSAVLGLILATLTLSMAGCSAEEASRLGLPIAYTDSARRITNLWQGAWAVALTAGVLVWGLIFWSVIAFRRRSSDPELPLQVRYNLPVEVLYTMIPLVVVSFFFFFTARDEEAIIDVPRDAPATVINVVGKRWSWDFNYDSAGVFETGTPGQPPMLWLPRGEKVRFVIQSRDVNHSFWPVNFLYKMDAIAGRTNTFEAVPERVGEFRGKCAELCGVDHSRMLFTVKVVERPDYDRYLESLRAAGQTGKLPDTNGPKNNITSGNDTDNEVESRS